MLSILYVDDEPGLLEICRIFLEQTGDFAVDTAISAQEALERFRQKKYDAIISDYQMPGIDGISFLKIVREGGNDIPFILFTGKGRESVVIDAINNGADFYLQKGGDPTSQFAELMHKVRQAVWKKRAEEELRDSEKRLSDIINFLPDATFAIDRQGTVIAWNRAIEEMTGVPSSDMVGKGNFEYAIPFYGKRRPILIDLIFEPDDLIAQTYDHIVHEKDTLIAHTTLPRPKGIPATLMGKAGPLYDRQGEIVGAIETIRDITDMKKAEDQLRVAYEQLSASQKVLRGQYDDLAQSGRKVRESEARFRELAELLPQIVFEMDKDFRITFVNHHAYTMLGYTPEDIARGFKALSVIDPSQHGRMRENIQKRLANIPYENLEYTFIRKDGSTFPALVYADPIRTGDTLTGFRGVVIDITERKRMEDALKEREATLSSIFRAAPIGIGLVSDRILLRLNDRICEMTGYSPEELVGKSARILYPSDDEFESVGHEKYEQIRQHGTGTVETRWQKKDGTIRDILLSSTPLDPGNFAKGVTFTALDITAEKQVQKELLKSEEKYRGIFENTSIAVFRTRLDGSIEMANPAFALLLGHETPEIAIRNIPDIRNIYVNPEKRDNLFRILGSQGAVKDFEFALKRADGSVIWVSVNVRAIRNSEGTITGLEGLAIDITGRRHVEESLFKINEIIESTSDMVWEVDHKGRYTYVSPVIRTLLGFEPKEVIGKTPFDLMPPDEAEKVKTFFSEYIDARKPIVRLENVNLHKDGHPVVLETSGEPVFDALGNLTGYRGIDRDISERKKAEDALRENEEMFRAIFGTQQLGILLIDAEDHHIVDINPFGANLIRLSREEIIGRICHSFICPAEQGKCPVSDLGQTVDSSERTLLRPDGSARSVLKTVAPLTIGGHKYLIENIIDITDRKRAEHALRRANEKLNLLNSITRHDVVNQLTILQGFTQLAMMKSADPAVTDFLKKIDTVGRTISRQIEFTKTYQELGVNAPKWIRIDEILDRVRPASLELAGTCRGTEIFADPMLEKVFANLIDNAIRHGQRVTRMSVSCKPAGDELVVTFEDNGIGIPLGEKQKIFMKGYGKNTGFGLFLAREILAITGISIHETGKYGDGARFEITVPGGGFRSA